jgi:hypothetical protein
MILWKSGTTNLKFSEIEKASKLGYVKIVNTGIIAEAMAFTCTNPKMPTRCFAITGC